MTGTWQTLRSLVSLVEAKSASDYKEDVFRYMTRRYGEHASDELRNKMGSVPFGEFKRHAALEYFDDKLDSLIDDMARAAIAARRAKNPPAQDDRFGSVKGPSGKAYMDPGDAAERASKIDAMIQARSAPRDGGKDAEKILMTPGQGGGHAVGSAGQHQPKQQPSIAQGVRPQPIDKNAAKSGLVGAQRLVDKATAEKGKAAGERLAKELGVPTTAERTTVHPDTGEKTVQIWSADRVFKHTDRDNTDVEDDEDDEFTKQPGFPEFLKGLSQRSGPGQKVSLKGADLTKAKSDADRKAQSHKRSQFTPQSGQMDPDRIEKIKQGLIQRNAAPTRLGPNRTGSFHGERWKPPGRETQVPMSRPDAATGNWTRGKVTVNPKHTGQETVWNQYAGEWQLPSVFASQEAERGAKMKAAKTPTANTDFDSDEKTDPDLEPFRG